MLNLVALDVPTTYDALGVLSIVNDAPEYFAIGTSNVDSN